MVLVINEYLKIIRIHKITYIPIPSYVFTVFVYDDMVWLNINVFEVY